MKILKLLYLLNLFSLFAMPTYADDCTAEYYPEYFSPFFSMSSGDIETSLMSQCTAKTLSISVWSLNGISEQQRINYTESCLNELKELIDDTYRKNVWKFKKNNKSILPISSYTKSLWLQRNWFRDTKPETQVMCLDPNLVTEFIKDPDLRYKLHFIDPIYSLVLGNAAGVFSTSAKTLELWDFISA